MSKHASKMTALDIAKDAEDEYNDGYIEAPEHGNHSHAERMAFGYMRSRTQYKRVVAELKEHQYEQDAEVARLKAQLDGVVAAVEGANRYRPVVMSARGAMISVEDGAWIKREDIIARIKGGGE